MCTAIRALICRELDRRYPAPPLVTAATRGLVTAIESWAERDLFWPIVRYVSGVNAATVDPQLHVDRALLRGKPAPSMARFEVVAQRNRGLVRAAIAVVEQLLAHGEHWLLGDVPGQADLAVYRGLWFLGAMPIDCSAELAGYPVTRARMARVAAIGHATQHRVLAPLRRWRSRRQPSPRHWLIRSPMTPCRCPEARWRFAPTIT